MIPFCVLIIGIVLLQLYCINAAVKIMRNKSIVASNRWAASLLVFVLPVVGVFLFKMIEGALHYKEYRFFSENFIDRVLYR